MRIAYCTNVRLPSERAHGHQIAQVCDALVHLGHSVHLFAPYRDNIVQEDYWNYYGAEKEVELTHLGSYDFIASPWTPGVLGLWTMNRVLRSLLASHLRNQSYDLVYTRAPALLRTLVASGTPVIIELHSLPRRNRQQFVRECNACALVACLTSAMRDTLVAWGVQSERVIVAGDAVDLRRFASLPDKKAARDAFNVPTERTIVGYVGRLKTMGMEKGVGIILEALARMRDAQQCFGLIVGGPEDDCTFYRAEAKRLGLTEADVVFTGSVPSDQVPTALAACDILAMPFPDAPHYRHNMSPLKMFEYMAAHRPIITSDLPTVRDVLSEHTAVFCEPGSVDSLVNAIQWCIHHPDKAEQRSASALTLVQEHSWEKRMERILNKL